MWLFSDINGRLWSFSGSGTQEAYAIDNSDNYRSTIVILWPYFDERYLTIVVIIQESELQFLVTTSFDIRHQSPQLAIYETNHNSCILMLICWDKSFQCFERHPKRSGSSYRFSLFAHLPSPKNPLKS